MFALSRSTSKKSKTSLTFLKKTILVLVVMGSLVSGKGIYMQGKALLAQQLLNFAWVRYLQDGEQHKAWSWADSAPFARLTFPDQEPLIILAGATGSNLAFAPSWMVSSAPFSQGGNSVIVGHNDTHFNHLKEIKVADQLVVSTYADAQLFYQVIATKVVNEKDLSVVQNDGEELLTLITCYPFDSAVYNSDLRFVVVAKRIKDTRSSINLAMLQAHIRR